jgi:HSP20 family protein
MSRDDLFANFDRMRQEMDELFGDIFDRGRLGRRGGGFTPAVDVFYRDDPPTAIVHVEIAGIDPDQISLEIEGRRLIVSGVRRPPEGESRVYQQLEIEHGHFRRVVSVGADVRADDARAGYEDGILRIELPLAVPESRTVPVRHTGAQEEAK